MAILTNQRAVQDLQYCSQTHLTIDESAFHQLFRLEQKNRCVYKPDPLKTNKQTNKKLIIFTSGAHQKSELEADYQCDVFLDLLCCILMFANL